MRTERLYRVALLIHRSPNGMTTGEIARECDVSVDTSFRDISGLEQLGFGVVRNGRRYILHHIAPVLSPRVWG